jgi:hypothetical protein
MPRRQHSPLVPQEPVTPSARTVATLTTNPRARVRGEDGHD